MVFLQGKLIHSFTILRQCRASSLRQHLVTSAQKRALNEEHIAGTTSKTIEPSGSSSSTRSVTQDLKFASIPLAVAVSGLTVYFLDQRDMLNGVRQSLGFPKTSEAINDIPQEPQPFLDAVISGAEAAPEAPETVQPEVISEEGDGTDTQTIGQQLSAIDTEPAERGVSVDRMAKIGFASSIVNLGGETDEIAGGIIHPEFGNRVTMEIFQVAAEPAAFEPETSQQSIEEELGVATVSNPVTSNISPNENFEGLSLNELKDRVAALSSELFHRSNWEGIRMAQFRQTLEQELNHKNMEELQKQRLAFEELMAKKIREVEDTTERRAKALLAQKEQEVEKLLEAAKFTLTQEHEAEWQAELENWNREYNASLQKEVAKQVAEVKEKYAKELAEKVTMMEDISQKLNYLEKFAEMSRSYEQASRNAHKISAAALALTTKLESTGKNSVAEINALRKAVKAEEESNRDGSGILVALDQLPQDVSNGSLVPTVSELQADFHLVKKRARAASKVPEGNRGLGAQLFSYAFSAITVEPDPDKANVPTDSASSSIVGLSSEPQLYDPDLILARAGKFVQLGDLETAVAELNQLKGQAAFTVQDWKHNATNRIMVNRMLKVVKLECALLNERMSE